MPVVTKQSTDAPAPIEIHKGGRLYFNKWVYNDVTKVGRYDLVDITDNQDWMHKRDEQVFVADGVTIDDLFQIVARDRALWDIILANCFIEAQVASWEALPQPEIAPDRRYDPDKIEYIELYWAPDLFTFNGVTELSGVSRAACHGIGYTLRADVTEGDTDYVLYKKGTRIQWGIDFMQIKDLVLIPLKLNKTFEIVQEWTREQGNTPLSTYVTATRGFTLQELLEGFFWETSFYGTPEDAQEKREELLGIKAQVDEAFATGTVEYVTTPLMVNDE